RFLAAVASAASSASRITDSGTPFSLATASTTSNSSLLISLFTPLGRRRRHRLVGLSVRLLGLRLVPLRAAPRRIALPGPRVAPGSVLRRAVAQRGPVGHQPRLVDVPRGHRERLAVDVEGDGVAFDRQDRALE